MKDEEKPEAKAAKATVYIDVEDEITSIIDKMESAGQKVVALVLPKRAATLQSIVNMRLLKRSADNAGKNVVLITTEQALLPLAGAAGLHVADSLSSKPQVPAPPEGLEPTAVKPKAAGAEKAVPVANEDSETEEEPPEDLPTKIDYKKSIGELASVHEVENPETIELGDEENPVEAAAAETEKLPPAPKDKRLKVPNFDKFRLRMFAGIAGFIALIVFIYLALAVLPKATIAVQTTSTPVSATLTLTTADTKTLDTDKGIIPAFSKTSDQTGTQSATATGQQNKGDKATGTVSFTDTVCGSIKPPTDVSAGTGVTSNSQRFITQATTHFSSSGTVSGSCISYPATSSTAITAISGGTKYNLSSGSTFAVDNRSDVGGSGSASGGTDNIQTVVSQSDVDNAVAKLKGAASTSFVSNFENNLANQGYYVFVSTLKQADPVTTATPDVGQPASSTSVSIKISYSVLCVKKDDLTKAISAALAKQIDPKKQKINDADILKGANITVSNQTGPTTASLNIVESTSAVPILDAASIKKQAAGHKSGDITSQISSLPGVKNVTVTFHPFWVSKAPKASKITVTLEHVNSSGSGQ